MKLKNMLLDIEVIRSGDFVYVDYNDFFINIVRNVYISEVIKLEGWWFCNVCSVFYDDVLVFMDSEIDK